MILRKTSTLELLIVASVCAFLFFYGLGNFGLVGADEPRYAQIAREMLERHDFISPKLNGEPWLEKPVLYYWLGMAAFRVFGVTDAAARAPSAALALAMVLAIYFYMRRFRRGSQLDAALIAASCAGVFAFSRGASTDMPLTASFTIAMLGWYLWYESQRKKWLAGFFFFLGLATLAKGPVAPFLAGLIVLAFCALRRDIKGALRTLWLPGVLLYLVVVLPWFVAVQIKNPEFLYVFILEHNLARFGSNMFHHRQPFWYYLPVFMLALAPWTLFAIAALIDGIKSSFRSWSVLSAEEADTEDRFAEFLVLWTLLPVLFFSLSQSKLPGYILPSIPPCAILTADFLLRRRGNTLSGLMIAGHALLLAVLMGFILAFPSRFIQHSPLTAQYKFVISLCSFAVLAGVFVVLWRAGTGVLRVATLTPILFMVAFVLRVGAPSIDNYYSARPVARQIGRLSETNPVAVFDVRRELRYGLSFYQNRKIDSYNDNEIPPAAHLLVAKSGSLPTVSFMLRNRQLVRLGGFSAQGLDYFVVSSAELAGQPPGSAAPPSQSEIPTK
jgi:4-amino-4-deoxy-L-arabinose transferase-like glycosyltransferase